MKPRTTDRARVLVGGFLFLVAGAAATRADVIISQVYEGQDNDRYVEVSNTGNAPINLSSYKLAIWRKSKSSVDASIDGITPSYAPLAGTLEPGGTVLLKNANANDPSYAANSGVTNASVDFDGNDAIAIVDVGNAIVDLFGVGINNSGQNYSRKATAPSASAVFNPANWDAGSYSVANNASPGTGDYLGFYAFTIVVQPTLALSPVAVAGLVSSLGTASAPQAYSLSGANLVTTSVSVAVSSSVLEVSTNSVTGFTNAITLAVTGGAVSRTLHVRISAAAPVGAVSATVNHTAGAASSILPVGGEVSALTASKAGPRLVLDYAIPANTFIGQPVGETVSVIDDTSGSIAVLQGLIDAARTANPDQFIRVRLKSNTVYAVAGAPLVLGSKMSLSGGGTTFAASAATTATSLVRISPGSSLVSLDRLTLEGAGKNLHGIEAHGVSRVNVDRVTVRETALDGISLQGLGVGAFDNEMTITRCIASGIASAAGIRVRDATQAVVMDNDCHNNATGILLETTDHASVVNNSLRYNSIAGVRLRESKNNKVASNLCDGNPVGIRTEGVATVSTYNFIFRNSIQFASTGIVAGQSRDSLYGNEFPYGVTTPLGFCRGGQ
jgi:parallel beta-helix repeat (two copies)